MDKVFDRCDFMFPCDSDEFLSPGAFVWAREAQDAILNIPELQWRTETGYVMSPHRHNRGGNKSTGIKHIYNPNTKWLNKGGFHRSRHVVFNWNSGKVQALNVPWHNHLHYLYWPSARVTLNKIEPGDPNFLCNGIFPSVYYDFIEERKKDPTYGKREGS